MSTNRSLQWQRVACNGERPTGRLGETMTTADDGSQVFVYGGMVEQKTSNQPPQYLDDFFVFFPEEARWERRELHETETSSNDSERRAVAFHTCVSHEGQLYVFGGCSDTAEHAELVRVDPQSGTREVIVPASEERGVQPVARYCHSAVVFEDSMYVFGGKSGVRDSSDRMGDVHRYDFRSRVWTLVEQHGDIPPPRSAHSAVVCGRRMFIFGGRQQHGCYGDMHEYNFDTHTWRRVSGHGDNFALERARHSAVLHNGVIAVFGGWNGRRKLNDLYLHPIDGSSTETEHDETTVPCRRECHAAVMWRNTMLVFSGRDRSSALDDVHAIRLGPPSLVEQCRDWLIHNKMPVPHNFPPRLRDRYRFWQELVGRQTVAASQPVVEVMDPAM